MLLAITRRLVSFLAIFNLPSRTTKSALFIFLGIFGLGLITMLSCLDQVEQAPRPRYHQPGWCCSIHPAPATSQQNRQEGRPESGGVDDYYLEISCSRPVVFCAFFPRPYHRFSFLFDFSAVRLYIPIALLYALCYSIRSVTWFSKWIHP